jgi:hypothetical protein
MQICEHTKRIGDNYGVSCRECGRALEGFGYGGWFVSNQSAWVPCIHAWWKVSAGEEECTYCHVRRERERKAN